jgi:DNA-binding IclR family transcriptional regulator
MLGPRENAAVVRWINAHSKRPHKAHELWATLLEHLRMDTGEVMATRQELAERVGIEPRHLSELMGELASINAVRREKRGRGVRYFLNPWIATHVPGSQARAAARQEAGPLLRVMEGGGGQEGA